MPSDPPQFKLHEGQLLEAIECLSDGFVILDERRRLVHCNQSYRDLYQPVGAKWQPGTPLEAIARDTAIHCIGIEDEHDVQAWVRARIDAHRAPADFVEQTLRDGRRIRVAEFPMSNGWSVGVRTDISLLRRAERRFTQSRRRMREILDNLPVGVSVKDTELHYLLVNREYERIYGLEGRTTSGHTPSEVK